MIGKSKNKINQKRYSSEFKTRTVALMRQEGVRLSQVVRDLGVSRATLQAWKRSSTEGGIVGKKLSQEELERQLKEAQDEVRKLTKENRVLQMEREILKKRRPSS